MGYQVADNAEPHRSTSPNGAELFMVDGGEAWQTMRWRQHICWSSGSELVARSPHHLARLTMDIAGERRRAGQGVVAGLVKPLVDVQAPVQLPRGLPAGHQVGNGPAGLFGLAQARGVDRLRCAPYPGRNPGQIKQQALKSSVRLSTCRDPLASDPWYPWTADSGQNLQIQ